MNIFICDNIIFALNRFLKPILFGAALLFVFCGHAETSKDKVFLKKWKTCFVAMKKANPEWNGSYYLIKDKQKKVMGIDFRQYDNLIVFHQQKTIKCQRNSNIINIEPLRGLSLKILRLSYSSVTSIAPLVEMPLRELDIANTEVKSLSPISRSLIKKLDISSSLITDLSVIKNLKLTNLDISNTQINDLNSINNSSLEKLNISNTHVSIEQLKLPSLKILIMELNNVKSLNFLRNTKISELSLSGCKLLEDLSFLNSIPLKKLDLSNTKVCDISFLQKMPLQLFCPIWNHNFAHSLIM